MRAATPELTGAQRRRLRALAHPLNPAVRLGQRGVTPAVVAEIERALEAHELIKVRLAGPRGEATRQLALLQERLACALVGRVGRVAILYRPHPDPGQRRP